MAADHEVHIQTEEPPEKLTCKHCGTEAQVVTPQDPDCDGRWYVEEVDKMSEPEKIASCRVIALETVRTLRALPDGLYHTNDIAPMWFRKKDGVIVCRNGTEKTFEEFVERFKSIVGPFRED
jgi:hypothetical protein